MAATSCALDDVQRIPNDRQRNAPQHRKRVTVGRSLYYLSISSVSGGRASSVGCSRSMRWATGAHNVGVEAFPGRHLLPPGLLWRLFGQT